MAEMQIKLLRAECSLQSVLVHDKATPLFVQFMAEEKVGLAAIDWPPHLRCHRACAPARQLSEDNLWRCEKCADFRTASKQFHLWKLPPHLVIHLKRFKASATGQARAVRP